MNNCMVAGKDDVVYKGEITKEDLWHKYYTHAPAQRRTYDPEFKKDTVELVKKIGLSHAAKKLDIPLNNLQRWKG